MIEARIYHVGTEIELARITLENVSDPRGNPEFGDFSVRFAADRSGAVGIHQRAVYAFPRTKYNVLALLLQALNTLEPSELELTHGTSASDLARRFRGVGKEVQRRSSRLHRD